MPIEKLTFGPQFDFRVVNFTTVLGPEQLIGSNARRVLLTFTSLFGADITVSPDSAVDSGQGMFIGNNEQPLILKFKDWGGVMRMPWYVFDPFAPGQLISVLEVFILPPAKLEESEEQ